MDISLIHFCEIILFIVYDWLPKSLNQLMHKTNNVNGYERTPSWIRFFNILFCLFSVLLIIFAHWYAEQG